MITPRLFGPARPVLVLAVALLALQAAFLAKPIHIDDPLFVQSARHLLTHPFDPFGFDVNWYDTAQSMVAVTQNPPLACYYLAAVMAVFGPGEFALHVAMLLPAWGVLWGTYRLAGRLGARPLPAALLTLVQPGFLVCSGSLMCDTLMVCGWVWAILLWDRGLRDRDHRLLYVAGGLVAATALTKYFGICLVPLLLAYSVAACPTGWRRGLAPLACGLIPVAAYDAATALGYGRAMFTGAVFFASKQGSHAFDAQMPHVLTGVSFLGGCAAGVLFLVPVLWGRRAAAGLTLAAGAVGLAALGLGAATAMGGDRWWFAGQFGLCAAAGTAVVVLVLADLWSRRDPGALLLALWVAGTFLFATCLNWTVNARTLLPALPAVGILLGRRLAMTVPAPPPWRLALPGLASAVLAVLVCWADDRLATTGREAAVAVAEIYAAPDRVLWYQGHWGFQYYLDQSGTARFWDVARAEGRPGDRLVIPVNNTNLHVPPPGKARRIAVIDLPACPWLATMSSSLGAGCYSSQWGPVPFAFGPAPPERYEVFELLAPAEPGAPTRLQ